MSPDAKLPATTDAEMPSIPSDHTATRAHSDPDEMLVHSTENGDEWIQGRSVDPTNFR